MSKILRISVVLLLVFLVGCNGISQYDDKEVAAIVKDKEITIGELRFLYPDDTALDYLDGVITVELVKQEVKGMDLDISDNSNGKTENDWFLELPPEDTNDEGGKQIRKFAESQAKKLNINPEEFQGKYAKKMMEQNTYLVIYLEEKLGAMDSDDEKEIEEFKQKADILLEKLMKENEDDITVFIE